MHHLNHGPQYVGSVYTDKLKDYKIAASTGSIGDSYDNALAISAYSSSNWA